MDAKFSHVHVSSPASPQAEQLHQRAIDWPSAMEAAAPVITGEPLPSDLEHPEYVPDYNVFLVNVPASFEPTSWHTCPPGCNTYPSGEVAAEVVAAMNRAKIKASPDGSVKSWFIRLRKSTGGASISVSLSEPFFPRDEYDMPRPFMAMRGKVSQWRGVIADLNERLKRAAAGRGCYQRAYVAHSIRPEDLKDWDEPARESSSGGDAVSQIEQGQPRENVPYPEKHSEKPYVSPIRHNVGQGDPAPQQYQSGSVFLFDVPKDYKPNSIKSLPGAFQKVKDKELAQVAAFRANQRLIERSTHGGVFAWYIPVDAAGGYGIVQLNIPAGWTPASPCDMPEPMAVVPGRKKRKQFLKELNRHLDKQATKGRKRAYAAIPIERPEVSEMIPEDATERQAVSEIEADFMRCGHFQTDTSQQNGNGHSRLLNHLQAMNR